MAPNYGRRFCAAMIIAIPNIALAQSKCFVGSDSLAWLSGCIETMSGCKGYGAWTVCHEEALKRADAELNRNYGSLLDVTPVAADVGPTREEIVRVQRAWIRWKDEWCTFEASANSGRWVEARDFLRNACLLEATKDRSKYISNYYSTIRERP